MRSVRLATGLVLFVYVGTHLLNHALGNISLAGLERGLLIQKFIWQGWPGTGALYVALTAHFLLGLWSLYERRTSHWTPGEVAQLMLGLCIPPLLANHVVDTRIAFVELGQNKGYAQVLYSLGVTSPFFGWMQVLLLVVAWSHGCCGIGFWVRIKRWFGRWRSALLCVAVLLPVLALLGYMQGRREVIALAQDAGWRAVALRAAVADTSMQNHWFADLRNDFLLFDGGALLLVLTAKLSRALRERSAGRFRIAYPDGRKAYAPAGFSVLEASRLVRIPYASMCGGRARCTLCRVRVVSDVPLPPPDRSEQRVLERLGADSRSVRLACQLRPTHDLAVWPLVQPKAASAFIGRRQLSLMPYERFGAFMFIDMRESTRLAAIRLPFDSIFIVSRFIAAVCSAVVQAGGQPNQFLGDAVLAYFGLDTDPLDACRQALAALPLVARNIDALNTVLEQQLDKPIRFGIGLHCGRAVFGEISFREHGTFTALGDPLNVASRLQQLTREHDCEALVSDEVFRRAGISTDGIPSLEARLGGRDAPVPVRVLRNARQDSCTL
ncbi:2Fe-2S iron-sulfur cluster-binding protein [Paraburkholderia sp. CI3]|uniref:adenylate/guanylate cyclase domain-containing protein n=1 Tax=Paraburkholderia sp. CI3 TaxID=2991060 RepID=UPI003D1BF743